MLNYLECFRVSCITGDQFPEANWHRDTRTCFWIYTSRLDLFQALQFCLNGPYFDWETVHRVRNARLLVDAARRALGADNRDSEYRNFKKDIEKEIRTSRDGDETVRYSLKLIDSFHEFAPSARLMH